MTDYIIGIGSNINAQSNIKKAIEVLKRHGEINAVSDFVITKPIGITDQDDFHNGALWLSTQLSASELNHCLKSIEDELGRDRSRPKFGPREIDLDIVVNNNKVVDDDYHTRSFLREAVDQIWKKK